MREEPRSERFEPESSTSGGSSSAAEGPLWVRWTIDRPVTVLVLALALIVLGAMAFPRIRTELLPKGMQAGQCGVYVPVREGTPREVMEQIAKPTEDLLRTLPGLESVVSSSGARRCMLRLEFDPRYDMSVMAAEVRDRVDRARSSWPEGVDRYFVWRHSDSDLPVYIASMGVEMLEDDENGIDLDYIFEEKIRRRLEAVPGVARVNIWGLLEKRVEISLDKDRVDAYGIDLYRLIQHLLRDNASMTAGVVRDGEREFLVRVDGQFRNFDEVLDYPVDSRFRIRDFAEVKFATAVRDRLSRVNGHLSRVVIINKNSSANAVEVCARIRQEIAGLEGELRRTVPGVGSVESHAWLDQGEMIGVSITSLGQNGLIGGLCAILVLWLFFRRIRMTLLVTLAIPFSLLITVVWLFFAGMSFNLLTLMGLSLGIGMLVDNSIVVVENILRYREAGYSRREAAIEGVREVGLAVALATLTTIMVFVPLFFMSDPRFRTMLQTMGSPLCVSVLASLLVALVFVPQGAIWLPGGPRRTGGHDRLVALGSRFNRATRRALEWVLARRPAGVVVVALLLASTFWAFQHLVKADTDIEGRRDIELRLELPDNETLDEANDTFARVEAAVREASDGLGVRTITSWFDAGGGELHVFFDPGVRVAQKDFFARVQPRLPRIAGVKYHLGFESFTQNRGEQRVRVYIEGRDLDKIAEAEKAVQGLLENDTLLPELGEVERWSEQQEKEVRVEVRRPLAQQFGIATQMVSRMVSWSLRGAALPDFVIGDREFPFWIRHSDAQKESIRELDSITVPRPGGEPVRLENLASYQLTPGLGDIHRRDGMLTSGLSASIIGEGGPFLGLRLGAFLSALKLPEGCKATTEPPGGGFEKDLANTGRALGMALCLVFFVMGLLFESWLLPLAVLLSVPFAFFGAAWMLFLVRVPLDGIGMIGMLMLVGIVVNNAIVLVDYINRLRARGQSRARAVLDAVSVRFRPIWMTALTTIFGLVPLAVIPQQGEGVDYKALALVMIGGLATSTFFTLIVVPLLYTLLDDVARIARTLLGRAARERREPARSRLARPRP